MSVVYLADEIQKDSILDGKGLRTVIWFQGCLHNCKGCHNPHTHELNVGIKKDIEELKKEIKELKYQDGITFSGGDPMFQPEALLEILKYTKSLNINTWLYTGYKYEDILNMKDIYKEILTYIDVLVDGKFIEEEKSLNVPFRGSKNQRLIDVNKSLLNNTLELYIP